MIIKQNHLMVGWHPLSKTQKEDSPRRPPVPRDRMTLRILGVCDAVGAFIEGWGFRAIHGRVWALLALSRAPMPQTVIAETLGVSRSLVSLAISELMEYGLVRPHRAQSKCSLRGQLGCMAYHYRRDSGSRVDAD